MIAQAPDSAVFLTRADVANLLRLTRRSVDRLAKDGELQKIKLGKSRSGFHPVSVERYLAKLNASASAPQGSASRSGHIEVDAISGFSNVGHIGGEYGSRCIVLVVEAEGATAEVAEALDDYLATNGFAGCLVTFGGGSISVIWAKSIGYQPDAIRKAIVQVKATAVHA